MVILLVVAVLLLLVVPKQFSVAAFPTKCSYCYKSYLALGLHRAAIEQFKVVERIRPACIDKALVVLRFYYYSREVCSKS